MTKDEAYLEFARKRRSMGSFRDAIELLHRIPDSSPISSLRNGHLADLLERIGEPESALVFADQIEIGSPGYEQGLIASLRANTELGRTEEAITKANEGLAQQSLSTSGRAKVLNKLGFVYEKLEQFDEAFAFFSKSNALFSEIAREKQLNYQDYWSIIEEHASIKSSPGQNEDRTNSDTDNSPLFLVGVPRSGTTLLETLFSAHPKAQVLSEKFALNNVWDTIIGSDPSYGSMASKIQDIDEDSWRKYQKLYFEYVDGYLKRNPGNILVDKLPLSIIKIPFLLKLFPDAKIICAIRDPRDVCISCFKQGFKLNVAMSSFLSLETAVDTYVKIMEAFLSYLEFVPASQIHMIRYEDVVTDFDSEVQSMLSFAGLENSDKIKDFFLHARRKRSIATPSYNQVNKPIYQKKAGHWKNYERYLKPHLTKLEPFLKRFDYEL